MLRVGDIRRGGRQIMYKNNKYFLNYYFYDSDWLLLFKIKISLKLMFKNNKYFFN